MPGFTYWPRLCSSKLQLCADRPQTSSRRRILLRRYKASDSSLHRRPDRRRGLEAQPCLAPAATATAGRSRKESPEAPSGRIRHPRFCDPTSPSTSSHALWYLNPEWKRTSMPHSPFEILETFLCTAPVKNSSALAAAFAFMALKTTHQRSLVIFPTANLGGLAGSLLSHCRQWSFRLRRDLKFASFILSNFFAPNLHAQVWHVYAVKDHGVNPAARQALQTRFVCLGDLWFRRSDFDQYVSSYAPIHELHRGVDRIFV